jgi:ABC-type multidrug transport system fused ATPase/permease subunit
MLNLVRRVWEIFRPFHRVIYIIVLFQTLLLGFQLLQPYFYGKIIDSIFHEHPFSSTLVFILIALALSVTETAFATWKQVFSYKNFNVDVQTRTIRMTAEKLFSFSPGQHRNEHSGLTQSVVADGQTAMTELLGMGIEQALPIVITLPIATVAVFLLSWQVGLALLIGFVAYTATSIAINRKFMPDIKKNRDISQNAWRRWKEVTQNAALVVLHSEERATVGALNTLFEKRNNFWKSLWTRYALNRAFGNAVIVDFFLALSFGMAAYYSSHGTLRIGAIVTLMFWVSHAFGELSTLNSLQRNLLDAQSRAIKYFALLDVKSDVPLPINPIPANNIRGEIVFENVSFTYSGIRYIPRSSGEETDEKLPFEALHSVGMSIKHGEHVAFVGRSGAGKSTAILLLSRGADPSSGKILIDGFDLRDLNLEEYRRRIGFVSQEIILFDDTLRFNISFGLGDGRLLSDIELDRLATITRMDQFRGRLKKGWDTRIGENGIQLSGGERQRVAIARALAKNPTVLIFDEATSNLDTENEACINEEIDRIAAGRTSIFIAHRLSTVRKADRIFVFDGGRIVGVGPHKELLANNTTYRQLVSRQTEIM